MAETSGAAAPPPAASRRPDAVAFLPRTRFVRLVAALPKLSLHRRVLTAVSPPLPPEPKYPDYASQPQPPSPPTLETEAPKMPERPETEPEKPPHVEHAAAAAAVAGEHQARQHNDFTVYGGDARTDAECWYSATLEARVEETPKMPPKRPEALAETPKKAKRPETEPEQPPHVEHAAAAAAKAVAGKYWAHRHNLFSLYDRGVRMDADGWYSATPESVAAAQAARAAPADLVVDAFAGVGGNSIQFAARGCYVVAVDIDPRKVELARHNARIYGVEGMIEFVVGDFFRLAPYLKADLVFLSPPWGGPSYNKTPVYTLDMLKPKDGYTLFQVARKIAPNIMMFLPRNVDISQVEKLSWLSSPPLDFESEENYVQHRFKGITVYFGNVAR